MITLAIITVLRFEVVNSRASFATWVVFLIFSVATYTSFLSSVSLLVMVLLFFAILTLILQRLIKIYSKNVEKDTNKTYSQSKIEKWGYA